MIVVRHRLPGLVAAAALLVVFLAAFAGLPHYGESRGPYEQRRAVEAVRARHATNLNAFVNFDYRALDTLGEEYILLIAVGGFALLLRERRRTVAKRTDAPAFGRAPGDVDPVLRVAALTAVPIVVLFGLYIVIHGQLTPGGGFQGGVAIATGALAIYLALDFERYEKLVKKETVEAFEAAGSLGYVVFGIASLVMTGSFLRDVLPIGDTGALVSSGQILALNDVVGIAVTGGFIVVFSEFLKETLVPEDRD